MSPTSILAYGVACYAIFFVTFLYAIGFVGNLVVPKSIDSGSPGALPGALVADLLLLALFGVQHSTMARAGFKRGWTRWLAPATERSTYVLISSLTLLLVCGLWRPLTPIVWNVDGDLVHAVLEGAFWAGWLLVLSSTFMIDHFELFGLRQVWLHSRGRTHAEPGLEAPWLYRFVRHPLMLGFLVGFWATPQMTLGHLVFALGMTAYILVALRLEERDLVALYGDAYREYQKRVPMLVPARGERLGKHSARSRAPRS